MYTDEEIIRGLRERDEKVTVYLQKRYFTLIEHIVCTRGGSHDDAEDIFNDVMIAVLPKVDTPGFHLTCKFKSFLYAVADRMWKLRLEKKRVAGLYPLKNEKEPDEPDFSENYDRTIIRSLLEKSFYRLGEDCRKIMRMFWDEIPQRDIAETLGFSYGYLRKRKFTCQKHLIQYILADPGSFEILSERIPKFSHLTEKP